MKVLMTNRGQGVPGSLSGSVFGDVLGEATGLKKFSESAYSFMTTFENKNIE